MFVPYVSIFFETDSRYPFPYPKKLTNYYKHFSKNYNLIYFNCQYFRMKFIRDQKTNFHPNALLINN